MYADTRTPGQVCTQVPVQGWAHAGGHGHVLQTRVCTHVSQPWARAAPHPLPAVPAAKNIPRDGASRCHGNGRMGSRTGGQPPTTASPPEPRHPQYFQHTNPPQNTPSSPPTPPASPEPPATPTPPRPQHPQNILSTPQTLSTPTLSVSPQLPKGTPKVQEQGEAPRGAGVRAQSPTAPTARGGLRGPLIPRLIIHGAGAQQIPPCRGRD